MKELNSSTNRSSLDSLGSAILEEGYKWSKHVQVQQNRIKHETNQQKGLMDWLNIAINQSKENLSQE